MSTEPIDKTETGAVELRDRFRLDVGSAVDFFGGFKEWGDRLEAHGMQRPIYNNYRGWRGRNNLAPHWIFCMIRLNALEGGDFNLDTYIISPLSRDTAPAAEPAGAVIAKRDTAPVPAPEYPPEPQPVPPVTLEPEPVSPLPARSMRRRS